MITQVNYRPKFYSPGYNPVIWSVTSDKANDTTLFDFAYVFDVYIDGSIINRIVQRPNPSYAGMIDVSSFVQPYLDVTLFANEYGMPTSTPFKTGTDAVANVLILAGEQYRTSANGTLNIYPGTTNASTGEPAYVLGAQGYTQQAAVILPASLSFGEQQKTMQVQNVNGTDYYGLFGELAPYVLKNDNILAASTCAGPGLFLSDAPRTTPGGDWRGSTGAPDSNITAYDYAYDRHTVTFLNRNPVYQYSNSGTVQASSPNVALFTFYNATGGTIGTKTMANTQAAGGGPRTVCGGTISGFSTSNNQELVSVRVGPIDLEELGWFGAAPTGIGEVPAYYTMQLFANATVNANCVASGLTTPVSEIITIYITEDCTSYLYPRVRLSWLNNIGGHDYFNFNMFAEQTIDTDTKEYYREEVNWSATKPIITTLNNGQLSTDITPNWLAGGIKNYNKNQRSTWTITSDWLTQDQVDFVKGVVASSQVWAYIGQDEFPYSAKIRETSYTVKTIKQVKMYTVTFNVEIATTQQMQNI